jgi:hypothetical protein
MAVFLEVRLPFCQSVPATIEAFDPSYVASTAFGLLAKKFLFPRSCGGRLQSSAESTQSVSSRNSVPHSSAKLPSRRVGKVGQREKDCQGFGLYRNEYQWVFDSLSCYQL